MSSQRPRLHLALILALAVSALGFSGCGTSSEEAKKNSLTGVSESGYPKGNAVDEASPAIGAAGPEEEHGKEAGKAQGEKKEAAEAKEAPEAKEAAPAKK